ncbi:hypothetical protein V6C53_07410 [Desulfocurvibacter africanus]|uniref:hypothetical protein n=1 Tax=Desulfocurvibacter africanus TaxID=873 RepID=UPI002FDA023C
MPDKRQVEREAEQANKELRDKRGSSEGYEEVPGMEFERMRVTQGAGVGTWSRQKAKERKSADGKVEQEMEELKRQREEGQEP